MIECSYKLMRPADINASYLNVSFQSRTLERWVSNTHPRSRRAVHYNQRTKHLKVSRGNRDLDQDAARVAEGLSVRYATKKFMNNSSLKESFLRDLKGVVLKLESLKAQRRREFRQFRFAEVRGGLTSLSSNERHGLMVPVNGRSWGLSRLVKLSSINVMQ